MPEDSFSQLTLALTKFLKGDPSALLLRGEWGIGKTYACLGALTAKDKKKQVAFSYVSLYGVATIDDVYSRVALGWSNSVTEVVPDWARDLIKATGETAVGIADIFKVGGVAKGMGSAAMVAVRNMIIVIDDLERRHKDLSITSALGIISYLVESRKCRVILISNDNALEGDDKLNFNKQKEKVFETELLYNPSVEENANIFAKDSLHYMLPPLKSLNVRNLRVIRRVDYLLKEFQRHLSIENPRTNERVFMNVVILGLFYHGFRHKVDITSRKPAGQIHLMQIFGKNKETLTESDQLFIQVGFSDGPADAETAEFLHTGTIDWAALNRKLENQEVYFEKQEIEKEAQNILNNCYCNFITPQDQIVPPLLAICEAKAEFISPSTLEFAETTLRELKVSHAGNWLQRWAIANVENLTDEEIQNIQDGLVAMPPVIQHEVSIEATKRRGRVDIHDVLLRVFNKDIHSQSRLTEIAALPVDEYVKWLGSSSDQNIRFLVRSVFTDFTNQRSPEKDIAQKVYDAVQLLSAVSDVNRIRGDMMKRSLPPQFSFSV